MSAITGELWRRCWNEAGALFYRDSRDALQRQLRLAARLDDLLASEVVQRGPLSGFFTHTLKEVRREAKSGREMLEALKKEASGVGPRGRGRETRFSMFVRLMFRADPALPRSPGPWMKAADRFGPVEPSPDATWSVVPVEAESIEDVKARRWRQWKDVLRRVLRRVGAKSRRK